MACTRTQYLVTRGICSTPRAIPSSLCRPFVVIYRTDHNPVGNSMPSASNGPSFTGRGRVQAETERFLTGRAKGPTS